MRALLIAALAAGLPLSNAFAQQDPVPAFAPREPSWAVFFFLSAADDRTTRPTTPNLNPACWSSKTTGGIGALVEYKTPVSIVLGTGFHYLGTHQNRCTPNMELRTGVIPFTVAYAIPLGSRIVVAPRIGLSYMYVDGDFGSQNAHASSVKATYGLSVEGALSQRWALRGQIDRYTGDTNLFGLGEFHQRFVVASFGGVFKW